MQIISLQRHLQRCQTHSYIKQSDCPSRDHRQDGVNATTTKAYGEPHDRNLKVSTEMA